MDEERIERVIGQLESLPTLPSVATRLLRLTADSSTASARAVSQIIESDQALTARILRLVNSAYYGLGRPIGTVAEAVVLMGLDTIRHNVLSVQVFGLLSATGSRQFDRKAFWKHSVAVGCCAELLAEHLGGQERDEAFAAGLLHDIGKVALDFCFPVEFARAMELVRERGMPSVLAEQREIGADHTVVGKRLAERWRLPESIVRSIWFHHQPLSAGQRSAPGALLVNLVHLSDVIVGQQHIGLDEGRPTFVTGEGFLRDLGLDANLLAQITRSLRQRIETRAEVLGLDDADEVSLFLEAIQTANRQLGRINERLAQVNAQLQLRVKRAAALNDLNTRLLPAADVEHALALAAETLERLFDSERAVCYVIDEEHRAVLGALRTARPAETQPFHFQAPANGPDPVSETWVLKQLHWEADRGRVYVMPLTADGRTLGGAILHVRQEGLRPRGPAEPVECSAALSTIALALAKTLLRERLVHQAEHLARANRDLEQTYAELLETQKLKAVATLAAGAAHEINNPLAIISGRAQFLKSREPDPKKQQELDLITEQCLRISKIINDLVAYARPGEASLRRTDLKELAERLAADLGPPLADRRIQLHLENVAAEGGAPKPPVGAGQAAIIPVQTDPDQVRALVGGLALALTDALPAGAGLRLTTHAATLADSAELRLATVGAALPVECLPSIFEPFFSVSLHGRGFGLAFAKCQSGIKQLGGDIWVDAEGGATRFRILLPLAG
jgi:putative nucleotidyltransferase with HDIG domain